MCARRITVQFVRSFFCSVPLVMLAGSSFASDAGDWTVANIGDPINSADDEAYPTITKDGLALYFARRPVGNADGSEAGVPSEANDWDIFVSTRLSLDAPWGEPQRLPDHINTDGEEHSVSLSPDGHWMYFSSTELGAYGGFDIFKSYRSDLADELAWGKPENLGRDVNTAQYDVCVIYHQEENSDLASLYFVSNREGTTGQTDIWRIGYDPKSGEYSEAENILAVSSPLGDFHLDPEAGFVWTKREGGFGGGDIWHSDKDDDGNWLPPVNLGNSINTEYEEQLPSPFDHGRIIYFPSDRPGGSGNRDIYIAEKNAL